MYYYHPHCCYYVNPCYPVFMPLPYYQPYTSYPHAPGGYNTNAFPYACCRYENTDNHLPSNICIRAEQDCPPASAGFRFVRRDPGTMQTCDTCH